LARHTDHRFHGRAESYDMLLSILGVGWRGTRPVDKLFPEELMKISVSLFLLSLVGAVSSAAASPISYVLTFVSFGNDAPLSGGGVPYPPAPVGSFMYDPAPYLNQFSSFTVAYDGLTFDLTNSENRASGSPVPGCPNNVPGSTLEFLNLTEGVGCGGLTDWTFFGNGSGASFYLASQVATSGAAAGESSSIVGETHGFVYATAAPEPSTLGLWIVGGSVLAWGRRRVGR